MTSQKQVDELEIRRRSQELAAAWRKGRAAFVLDRLAGEEPLRAALIGSLVYEQLARWDPYDSRWPNGFRHALVLRSLGLVTPEELSELQREYALRFGSSPPPPPAAATPGPHREREAAELHARRIRQALASGRPLVRERSGGPSPAFLRLQPASR